MKLARRDSVTGKKFIFLSAMRNSLVVFCFPPVQP